MGNFFNQTVFCPVCGGSGFTDIEDAKSRAKCQECQGNGVFVRTSDALMFFNSSSYFDFLKREGIKSRKIIYLVIGLILLAGAIFGFFLLMNVGKDLIRSEERR